MAAITSALRAGPLPSLQIGPGAGHIPGAPVNEKAATAAQNFEAVFLNSMFQEMFSGLQGEGPLGGGPGAGVWRSLLADEYAKSFAKSGGIGIGAQVYRSLLEIQETSQ